MQIRNIQVSSRVCKLYSCLLVSNWTKSYPNIPLNYRTAAGWFDSTCSVLAPSSHLKPTYFTIIVDDAWTLAKWHMRNNIVKYDTVESQSHLAISPKGTLLFLLYSPEEDNTASHTNNIYKNESSSLKPQ